ncbi:MAG: diaminopimelate epimerase [Luminiphilus sp.]|nr:diaminopimelate epimerase [Luminiphilus sp.]
MKVRFTKMHGAGNDFVVIDNVRQNLHLSPSQIRRLANRQRGIGCDQVLIVGPPDSPDADFRYHIFNADGSEAGQCGNGARCFARFVREQRLSRKPQLKVQAPNGLIQLDTANDGRIRAEMGIPIFTPSAVPFTTDQERLDYTLTVSGASLTVGVLSMGNPHAVMTVESVQTAPVATLGPAIEGHPQFTDRVNVGFMQVLSRDEIKLRVFERGAGETLACGTGACAAVVHGIRKNLLNNAVTVHLPGGKLSVTWGGNGTAAWLSGPTASVFEGTINLNNR